MSQITRKTASFNSRRFGRPWIARVTFSSDAKPNYDWGTWLGTIDGGNGSDGELIVNAGDGDIVADGQKDNRKGSSNIDYWQVRNGELVHLDGGKAEAYRLYKGA